MSPMDELAWWDSPVESYYTTGDSTLSTSVATRVAKYNPRRVAIIFSFGLTTGQGKITISTKGTVTDGKGLYLPFGNVPIMLNYRDHGNIVQGEWYAILTAAGSGNLTVLESLLKDWPRVE